MPVGRTASKINAAGTPYWTVYNWYKLSRPGNDVSMRRYYGNKSGPLNGLYTDAQ